MKNYVLLMMSFAFLFNANAQKWMRYHNSTARLQADFPTTPEEKIEDDDKGKGYTATLSYQGYVFMASAMHHKTNLDVEGLSQETMAKTTLEAFEKALGATKITSKNFYYRQDVGLEAEIEVPDYENTILYRCIVVGQVQYQIVAMKKTGKAKYGMMKKFLKSFRILN